MTIEDFDCKFVIFKVNKIQYITEVLERKDASVVLKDHHVSGYRVALPLVERSEFSSEIEGWTLIHKSDELPEEFMI